MSQLRIGGIVAALFLPAGLLAGTVSYTANSTDPNGLAAVQFDPSLGTLNSIDFSLATSSQFLFTLSNLGSSTIHYGVTSTFNIGMEDPTCTSNCFGNNILAFSSVGYFPSDYAGVPTNLTGMLAANSTINPAISSDSSGDTSAINCTDRPDLCAALTGTGTLLQVVDLTNSSTITSSGMYQFSPSGTQGQQTLVVTYSYTPSTASVDAVPEPASGVLLGGGLLLLAGAARRKGQKASR